MAVTLKKIKEVEYPAFIEETDADYYQARAKADRLSLEEATKRAKKQIAGIRSQGFHTPGHHYFHVLADGRRIGRVWLFVKEDAAYLYDIHLSAEERGKGYGKQTMDALESFARQEGARSILLNVFASNTVAQDLYRKQGYSVSSMHMRKDL